MSVCETCGKVFHYCSSCDYDAAHSAGFCSDECRRASPDYAKQAKLVDAVIEAGIDIYEFYKRDDDAIDEYIRRKYHEVIEWRKQKEKDEERQRAEFEKTCRATEMAYIDWESFQ